MPEKSWIVLDVRNQEDQSQDDMQRYYTIRRLSDTERENITDFVLSLNKHAHYILVCYKGMRSLEMAQEFRKYGIQAYSLKKGYPALRV